MRSRSSAQSAKQTKLLDGLGELLDGQKKSWAREHLKDELIFQLRLRIGE